jgi:hypothetical protein
MPKSKTPRATSKKLVARTTASGAQQYVQGKDTAERVSLVGKTLRSAIRSGSGPKNMKTRQMLARAQTEAMSPAGRARYNQMLDREKREALARGRKRSGK